MKMCLVLSTFLRFPKPLSNLCSHQARYFENPQVIAENTVPSPEMVGMITSVLVKTAPEREDSETRTVSYVLGVDIFTKLFQYCLQPLDGSSVPYSHTNRTHRLTWIQIESALNAHYALLEQNTSKLKVELNMPFARWPWCCTESVSWRTIDCKFLRDPFP